jgi:GST-like protein
MRDVGRSMSLSAPSLYNAFGHKRALFARPLEHYLDHTTRMRLRRLEASFPPKHAIYEFFDDIIKRPIDDRERKECFLVNSALEIAPHDRELGVIITERLGGIEAFFRRRIKGAQAEGAGPARIDARGLSRLFLGVVLGIRVLARSNPNRTLLAGVVRPALTILEFPPQVKERNAMIDLHYWTTPNGHKITIFLEEARLAYRIIPVNISKGDQFKPEFLAVSPNNRIPGIVDHEPKGGGAPVSVFESGAILLYLAEKRGKFLPGDLRERYEAIQWLFCQMGGLGPMAGQNHHFGQYAPEKLPYAIERYVKETNRLYGVLNRRLTDRAFIAGDYSIADMASYPWIVPHERQGQKLEDFPHLKRWFDAIAARPATKRAYALAKTVNIQPTVGDEASRKILFGQWPPPQMCNGAPK